MATNHTKIDQFFATQPFGLAYLLGIELMPRIRNWRSLKLYRASADHLRHTGALYLGRIDWALIHAHWEDYLRVVLAIQSGRVSASWILARLNSYLDISIRQRIRKIPADRRQDDLFRKLAAGKPHR